MQRVVPCLSGALNFYMLQSCVYNVVTLLEYMMLPEPSMSGPVSLARCPDSAEISFPSHFIQQQMTLLITLY